MIIIHALPEKVKKIKGFRDPLSLAKVYYFKDRNSMAYMEEICISGRVEERRKYYDARSHPKGEHREKKQKVTSDAQKRVNRRKAERELRRLMNTNFQDGDYLVRLDFFKENAPPDGNEMQRLMEKALRKLRAEYKKVGKVLKYIYVKEIGPKGGRHIHMMMNRCDTELIRKCWTYGGIHIDPLNSNGQYKKIASYFMKYEDRTEQTEGKLVGKRYYPSRSLQKPVIKKRRIWANQYKEKIREKKGYVLDKETVVSGISEFTGYAYFEYALIRMDQGGGG